MATDTPTHHGSSSAERRRALVNKLNPREMPLRYKLGILSFAGFALLPTLLFPDQMRPFISLLYLIMFAMSWDVVSGYTGQLSFGHGFFFAVGGYSSAILNTQHGISPALSIPLAMVVAGVAGFAVGLPALRLRGPYLSLVTLIVPVIFVKLLILFNDSLILALPTKGTAWFTIPVAPAGLGGTSGLATLPDPLFQTSDAAVVNISLFKNIFPNFGEYQLAILSDYYFSLALMAVVLLALFAVTRSSAGSVFTAIREDQDAVAAAGLNPAKFKLFAFVLSAAVGGLAGAALVHTSIAIAQPGPLLGGAGQSGSPIGTSINVIVVVVLGGIGTITGAVAGGVLFGGTTYIFENFIDFGLPLTEMTVSDLKPLPLLVLAMIGLVFAPGGALRELIESGREMLGEETHGDDDDDEGGSVIGQIVDNYRDELNKVTGDDDDEFGGGRR